jgi:hypothetical protein
MNIAIWRGGRRVAVVLATVFVLSVGIADSQSLSLTDAVQTLTNGGVREWRQIHPEPGLDDCSFHGDGLGARYRFYQNLNVDVFSCPGVGAANFPGRWGLRTDGGGGLTLVIRTTPDVAHIYKVSFDGHGEMRLTFPGNASEQAAERVYVH